MPHSCCTQFLSVRTTCPNIMIVCFKVSYFTLIFRKRTLGYYLILRGGGISPLNGRERDAIKALWTHTSSVPRQSPHFGARIRDLNYSNYTKMLSGCICLPGQLTLPSLCSYKRTSVSQGRDSQEFMTQSTYPIGA